MGLVGGVKREKDVKKEMSEEQLAWGGVQAALMDCGIDCKAKAFRYHYLYLYLCHTSTSHSTSSSSSSSPTTFSTVSSQFSKGHVLRPSLQK